MDQFDFPIRLKYLKIDVAFKGGCLRDCAQRKSSYLQNGGVVMSRQSCVAGYRYLKEMSAILVVAAMVLSVLPILSDNAAAVSSDQSNLRLLWPNTNTVLNQTVGTYVQDGKTPVGLSVNAWDIALNRQTNYNSLGMAIELSSNSRQGLSYSAKLLNYNGGSYYQAARQQLPIVDYNPSSPSIDPFPDNGGVWLDYYFPSDNNLFGYHGAYYNKIFVASNGFIVLSHSDYYLAEKTSLWWGSPTMPSIQEPNTLIAPLWRDLDPSKDVNGDGKPDGEIRAGWYWFGLESSNFYVILWRVPNKLDNNIQEFAVLLRPMKFNPSNNDPLGSFRFWYDTITYVYGTVAGLEDQFGGKYTYVNVIADSNYAITSSGVKVIKDACILVSKQYKDTSGNWVQDTANSYVTLIGLDGSGYPGGTNLILEDPLVDGRYTSDTWLSVGGWILSTALLFTPMAPLGVAGYAYLIADGVGWGIGTYQMSKELTETENTPPNPTTYCGIWGNALTSVPTTWTRMNAKDEAYQQFYAWDIQFCAYADWMIKNSALDQVRRVVITGKVNYTNFDGSGVVEEATSTTIEIGKDPNSPAGGVKWLGKTNPDGHFYNFYPLASDSTPSDASVGGKVGDGYHIDSIGSSDSGFQLVGWGRLDNVLSKDYKVRADGSIRVEGYFKMYDTLTSTLKTTGRLVNLYVMYSDADRDGDPYGDGPNTISKTVKIMTYTEALNSWKFKSTLIDGLTPGKSVKIGVGRPDLWSTDYRLTVEWAGVRVICRNEAGSDCWSLYVPVVTGGQTTPSTSTYCYNSAAGGMANGQPVTLTATPSTGYSFGWWLWGATVNIGNPCTVTINGGDLTATANFVSSNQKILYYTKAWGNGGVSFNPSGTFMGNGIYLYTSGTQVSATANPSSGWKLNYWLLDGVARGGNPLPLTMNMNHRLVAYFYMPPPPPI